MDFQMNRLLLAGVIVIAPVVVLGQQLPESAVKTPQPLASPAPFDESLVQNWAKRLMEQVNATWVEPNAVERESKLRQLAEDTPAATAFVTRALKRPEPQTQAAALMGLKDILGTMRRVTWRAEDGIYVQKVMASWSVLIPELVSSISSSEISVESRRSIGHILADLATLGRNPLFGSSYTRQLWQTHLTTLMQQTLHPKTTVRLVSLSVLESLAQDAASAKPAVLHALGDPDRFVRWSAIRALQTIGIDQKDMRIVATLQHDQDTDVRQAAIASIQAQPGGTEMLAQQQAAMPLRTTALGHSSKMPVPLATMSTTPPPSKAKSNEQAIPAKSSSAARAMLEPRKAPRTPAAKPKNELSVTIDPLPLQVSPISPLKSEPVAPTMAPAPVLTTPVIIEPMAAKAESDETSKQVAQLRHGSPPEQVDAIRALGKLGIRAGDAVPYLAETMITGDVTVRREIPLALMRIGTPAKAALSVLERALEDADTEVKVNAARALLALSEE